MTAAAARLTVDVVSDVVCPWCYVGKRRLEQAAGLLDVPLTIRWRPFQLDARIPAGGVPRQTYMETKFGSLARLREIHARLRSVGAEAGIAFDFDRIRVSPNTLDAHRVIRWAGNAESQGRIVESLFAAYFTEGRDIGDHDVLVELATAAGLDAAMVAARLDTDADADSVRAEIAAVHKAGVTGVPTFVLDGRSVMVGAQPAPALAAALQHAAGKAVRPPPQI